MAASAASTNTPRTNLTITRVFNAPQQLLFDMFTKPEHLMHWWGPRGCTAPHSAVDLRVGGTMTLGMRGPQNQDWTVEATITELNAPERLVFTCGLNHEPGQFIETTLTFREVSGGTDLTIHQEMFDSPSARGAHQDWSQSLDKLNEYFEHDRSVTIERLFHAPIDLVFAAFTDPAHIAEWWGPNGFTNTTSSIDIRVGGRWKFVMHGPDGTDYDSLIEYREITPPTRLAYSHINEDGTEIFSTVATFVDVFGDTHLTFHVVLPSKEARDFVVREHNAIEGGRQTIERFAKHLESR